MEKTQIGYSDERFADIQMLRYHLDGFEQLTLRQKELVYDLSEATLWGRDITFDQFGKHNLRIRKLLEVVSNNTQAKHSSQYPALMTYLKRVWFSNGIHHHYGCQKIMPGFTPEFLENIIRQIQPAQLPLRNDETIDDFCNELFPVIFNPDVLPKRVEQADGVDLVKASACHFYDGVSQQEAEDFYAKQKTASDSESEPPSFGLNSTLVKADGVIREVVWKEDGCYGPAISHITFWLQKAAEVAENDKQRQYINTLIKYYRTGNLHDFNRYCIEWVSEQDARVDFVNGFIEVYGDPLGLKGSWEGIVHYKDLEATKRTRTISDHAQWFEDHSPVDRRFKKKKVRGVVANVVCAAMLGGDEYPSTAIGINLPNADWIRMRHGSKSVTIGNLTNAYNQAARGNGFREEFVDDKETLSLIEKYGDICDDLHTDLHECLGHGSGQLLPGTDPDALKAYGSTIEEARADLFGLYFIADEKLVELGLTPDKTAYKSQYYCYMMNGLLTQLIRIQPGHQIEEAHMRNRALIARWCYEKGKDEEVMLMAQKDGKTFLRINSYERLRALIAQLLAEVQRIKSEGDYLAARDLVEQYGVRVDAKLHAEILERYEQLHLAPYKGFINPVMTPQYDAEGHLTDISIDYTESYEHQMRRYSSDYSALT